MDFAVVGIGLAGDSDPLYIDIRGLPSDLTDKLIDRIRTYKLVGHNIIYDSGAMSSYFGLSPWDLAWVGCTKGLHMQAANEGYKGQTHSLKPLQVDLLGWEEKGDVELDAWLTDNGHLKLGRVDKSKMCLAPAEILGKYCAMDAESTWLLWHTMEEQLLDFTSLLQYHKEFFVPNTLLLVEQQLRGISVDRPALLTYMECLLTRKSKLEDQFRSMPSVALHIEAYETAKYAAYKEATPKGRLDAEHHRFRFNVNSKQQLEWLFFDCLDYSHSKKTASGRRSVDKKSLPAFGEEGLALMRYNDVVKELGYVKAYVEGSEDGYLHPRFKSPGCVTGRIAGGG